MLELSTARLNKARASTLEAWKAVADGLTEKLQDGFEEVIVYNCV